MKRDRKEFSLPRAERNAHNSEKGFSLVPLLLSGESISAPARQALREDRMKDAAVILMKDYGLSCAEAGDLLNVSAC